jgi:hypothetical protein
MTFAFDLCPCFIFYDRAIISCRSRNTFQLIMHNLAHTKKKFEQLLFYCYESVFVPGMLRIAWPEYYTDQNFRSEERFPHFLISATQNSFLI